MDVSIIIVNYNVKEYIISCIESIYKQTDSNYKFEIIVIDNNSHDGSQKVIKEKFSNIKFIENKKNYGFSKAVNQASYYASGENLFILNPDTLFIENTINELLIESKKLDISGIIGPKIIDGNGKIIRSYWKKPTLKSAILSILHLDSLNFKKNYNSFTFNNISKVETLSGCAIFLPSKVFKELGGFNENLFWMEDIDLCARTEERGYSVYYLPNTKIVHFSGKSAEKNYKTSISNQLISKIKYFKLYHNHKSFLVILITILFISILKASIFFVVAPFSKIFRKKFLSYVYTALRILKGQFRITEL